METRLIFSAVAAFLAASLPAAPSRSQPAPVALSGGERVYNSYCAGCHDSGAVRAPHRSFLQELTPQSVIRSLTEGVMRAQGAMLSQSERVQVTEFLTKRRVRANADAPANTCRGRAARFDFDALPSSSAWGFDQASTHSVSQQVGGFAALDLPRLKLKWAFGFPDAQRARSQPVVAGGAILVGSHNGDVYALDLGTGCTRWRFQADAEVRTGIVISSWAEGDRAARPLAYFGDVAGNLYALNAVTGRAAWRISADDHPAATITAAPALHEGILYVPISSLEEAWAGTSGYSCCTFRGSVVAVDAASGAEKWRTWLVPRSSAQPTGQLGPSGVAVWNTPSIDLKRRQIVLATGDNYSQPTTSHSDAVIALDIDTGQLRWSYQATQGDAWNAACVVAGASSCPENAGPDYDFGAGTVLTTSSDGRDLLLAAQKSGIVYALDPTSGKLLWRTRVGRGGVAGGVMFGIAAANGMAFIPVSDVPDGSQSDHPHAPGLHALDLDDGKIVWRAPAPEECSGKVNCRAAYSGAISIAGELVIVGADDGHVRIYRAADGALLWNFDTVRSHKTVNGVPARGGAISGGAAPVPWRGHLIVNSGYGYATKMPGNALLVFDLDDHANSR